MMNSVGLDPRFDALLRVAQVAAVADGLTPGPVRDALTAAIQRELSPMFVVETSDGPDD